MQDDQNPNTQQDEPVVEFQPSQTLEREVAEGQGMGEEPTGEESDQGSLRRQMGDGQDSIEDNNTGYVSEQGEMAPEPSTDLVGQEDVSSDMEDDDEMGSSEETKKGENEEEDDETDGDESEDDEELE